MARRALCAATAVAAVLAAGVPAAVTVLAVQTERPPDTAVVNGVPQGMFVGRSLLTGKAVCLLFLDGGRITRAIPEGGLESFDWNRHRAAHSGDSGTWQMRGGQLVVTWGDGGVHQGPITVNAKGIEFYGKRYSKPAPVGLAALAGRWESARGTAIAGGAGINRISELVIQPDGRYQGGSTTGGVVSGRAVTSDQSTSGRITVKGLTIIFTSDAGSTTSHTFVAAAGTPVGAFSVDTDMFTRVGPAPALTPASSSTSTPAPVAPGAAPASSPSARPAAPPANTTRLGPKSEPDTRGMPATTHGVDYIDDGFVWWDADGLLSHTPPLTTVASGAGFPKSIPSVWQNDQQKFTLALADDGTYAASYSGSSNIGAFRTGEVGHWMADGTNLTLRPQSADLFTRSSNQSHTETATQNVGSPRTYAVTTLVLEYTRNNFAYRVDGIELKGPTAPWYYSPSGRLEIVLRRTGQPRAK